MAQAQGKVGPRFARKALAISLALCCGCASVSNPAHSANVAAASQEAQDCFAVGDVEAREACFAKKPDSEIAECERTRVNACAPYKQMHALEQQRIRLGQDFQAKARVSYSSYLKDDPDYLGDLVAHQKTADAAWAAYRDADCLLEPFAQGMSRREAPDLTEVCRVERTKARIEQLKSMTAALE
ncbi:lysozyme inhibitor LprI family protein [Lysobacter silvisoli]|uniref:DUF1311 domain-containing protein n=1 Tax=Lysobacter silvisoli TaxID=2293254 RepID=A0A371JWL1_9GAMM|nr:lysozyme inhibitor LprI family protein [Lysobacter silvisoli]RDZ25977.1 DUF1311 domain-containing protein [Lysobacter silvisoli]